MARDLHRVAERMKSSPWAGNPRNEMEAFHGNILVMGTYWKTIDHQVSSKRSRMLFAIFS